MGGRHVSGVGHALPDALQEDPLLRIHIGSRGRSDAEELGVEAPLLVNEAAPAQPELFVAAPVPPVRRRLAHQVLARPQPCGQRTGVRSAREAPSDTDNGDIVILPGTRVIRWTRLRHHRHRHRLGQVIGIPAVSATGDNGVDNVTHRPRLEHQGGWQLRQPRLERGEELTDADGVRPVRLQRAADVQSIPRDTQDPREGAQDEVLDGAGPVRGMVRQLWRWLARGGRGCQGPARASRCQPAHVLTEGVQRQRHTTWSAPLPRRGPVDGHPQDPHTRGVGPTALPNGVGDEPLRELRAQHVSQTGRLAGWRGQQGIMLPPPHQCLQGLAQLLSGAGQHRHPVGVRDTAQLGRGGDLGKGR